VTGGGGDKENPFNDLDEIARACREIDAELEKQQMRSKNKRNNKVRGKTMDVTTGVHVNQQFNNEDGENVEKLLGYLTQTENLPSAVPRDRLEELIAGSVEILIDHLDQYGACIIDNFLGEEQGNQVLKEVLSLDNFKDGQLASSLGSEQQSIRSDKIAWTDGQTPPCPALRLLTSVSDSIIINANRRSNNGSLGNYKINGRTKAMVACYPGGGSHYITHVDNPNRDGRCITAIYYLNKDWDSQRDGGALLIYSKCVEGVVAQVDPIFDRMLFFWSDRRNPHEVMPAHRERFAVTVWYMDETERREYEQRLRASK